MSIPNFPKARKSGDLPYQNGPQVHNKGKTRITIMLDNDVLASFRRQADIQGLGYQTLINRALRSNLDANPLDEKTLRRVIREEMLAI